MLYEPLRILYSHILAAQSFFALALGTATAFGMAPTHYWWLTWLGLAGFSILIAAAEKRFHAFILGWLFGFGYFVCGLHWIGNALLIESNDFAWAWPLAVSALPALLALFPATAATLARVLYPQKDFSFFLGLAGLLAVSEWLRGHIFTGFPWNLYGYAWADTLPLLQILYVADVYILTLLTLLWAVLSGCLFYRPRKPVTIMIVLFIVSSFSLSYGYGAWRLGNGLESSYKNDTVFKIVQPNIPQADKLAGRNIKEHFLRMLELSRASQHITAGKTFIVWPETAINFWVLENTWAAQEIATMLGSYDPPATLLTGILLKNPEDGSYSNSIIALEADLTISQRYDKSHLVPFGEYIPFQKWIPIRTVSGFNGFRPGPGPGLFFFPDDFKIVPLVCYEIIFPNFIGGLNDSADLIVNATNDAWYGVSAGPFQHFEFAKFRAIEEGIPVLRAANTGFSGTIDPYGRILNQSLLFDAAVITANIPAAINNNGTLKFLFISTTWAGLMFALIFSCAGAKRRNSSGKY